MIRPPTQAAAEAREQTAEAEAAAAGPGSAKSGAESDSEGADLQVCFMPLQMNLQSSLQTCGQARPAYRAYTVRA